MESLKYNDVIGSLFRSIPEAKAAYDAWDMPGDPLPHIVFSLLRGIVLYTCGQFRTGRRTATDGFFSSSRKWPPVKMTR